MAGAKVCDLLAHLPDIGESLSASLIDLKRDPEPARCEAIAIQLEGARRHVLTLAAAIGKEQRHECA